MLKFFGAILTVFSCGVLSFQIATSYLNEISLFRKFIRALESMENMLLYHCTPLPDLCRFVAEGSSGKLKQIFENFAKKLDMQIFPNVCQCMELVLSETEGLSVQFSGLIKELGDTLGKFDIDGQVKGLRSVRNHSESLLNKLEADQSVRIRSIKTMGICAGAAIAILLI